MSGRKREETKRMKESNRETEKEREKISLKRRKIRYLQPKFFLLN